jgi:hypothetical protein
VTVGELRGPAGGLVTVTNHSAAHVAATVRMPQARGVRHVGRDRTSNAELEDGYVAVELEPYDAAVFDWRS